VLIAVILGHVYIGTLGMQGAFDGMRSGYGDLNWAKATPQCVGRDRGSARTVRGGGGTVAGRVMESPSVG
jgi:formate dehydrogenase subunit gamma